MEINLGERRFWRNLTNFWTVVFILFIVLNFFQENAYEFMLTPIALLYLGILAIYVGSKEFDRWARGQHGREPGEIFIIIWTAVMLVLIFLPVLFGGGDRVPLDLLSAVYITVLSLFVFSQKSKSLYKEKKQKE